MMTIETFIERVVNAGIWGAQRDYRGSSSRQTAKREGAVAGFAACSGKTPAEIKLLLAQATRDREAAHRRSDESGDHERALDAYWRARCFEAEVEWVANCLSAALENAGLPGIVPTTARGWLHAARILGVAPPMPGSGGAGAGAGA